MKTLLLTTALVAVTSMGAVAQSGSTSDDQAQAERDTSAETRVPAFLSSNFVGRNLYTLDLDSDAARALGDDGEAMEERSAQWTSSDLFNDERDAWEDIGNIDDVVMTQDGEIRGVLVDVGGFLGIGAHTVMVDIETLYFVAEEGADEADSEGIEDFFVVATMSREELEELPEWDSDALSAGFAPMENETSNTAETTPGDDDTSMTNEPDPVGDDEGEGDAYTELPADLRTAETLTGASVHDANDENIGEVNDLILDDQNELAHVLVDVGGFLGIGSHTVALSVDDIEMQWHETEEDVRVMTQMTREQLEEMPAYEG
ncbi:MAG: PRC-barrel domain [Rhodobacteraceae bacterium HLUCCA12]|nr:MAG: PRC-barrel domain [Rhodobacteraceae bacterium HLUCCA12]